MDANTSPFWTVEKFVQYKNITPGAALARERFERRTE